MCFIYFPRIFRIWIKVILNDKSVANKGRKNTLYATGIKRLTQIQQQNSSQQEQDIEIIIR